MQIVDAKIVNQGYGFIKLAWHHVAHGESHTHINYLYKINENTNLPELVGQLQPELTNFKYSIAPQERGKTIQLGLAAYNTTTQSTGAIIFLPPIATIPNPPELLIVKQNYDNIVKLEWLAPTNATEIRGYLVERSVDQMRFEELGIASVAHFIDIGSTLRAPTDDNTYFYRVSSITYAGVQSSYISATINMKSRKEMPVPTLVKSQLPDLPLGNYRIKAVGFEKVGETPWINMHTFVINSKPGYPEIPSFRLRVVSEEGDSSLVVKSQNLVVSCGNENPSLPAAAIEAEKRIYRIRAISVDGVESHALLSNTLNYVGAIPNFIVNKTIDYITDKKHNRLINKGS